MKAILAINIVMTTLFKFGAPCVYISATQTLTNFEVSVDPTRYGTRVSKILANQDDLSVAVGRQVRIIPRGRFIVIQIPLSNRKFPMLSELLSSSLNRKPWHAILGYNEDGSVMDFNITKPDIAHIGVFGTTGSGKTSAMESLIASMCLKHSRDELLLYMYNPKFNHTSDFARVISSNLISPPDTNPIAAGSVLTAIVKQMELRPEGSVRPRVMLMVDEAADLCQTSPEAQEALTRISARGRGVGFHLIIGTQKPTTAALSSLMTANIPTRVIGKVVNARESSTASGINDLGAERLLGMGDFIVVKSGHDSRVQGVYPDLDKIPNQQVVVANPQVKSVIVVKPADLKRPRDSGLNEWMHNRLQPGGILRGSAGYQDYESYCAQHGLDAVSLVAWGKHMRLKYDRQQDKLGVFYNLVSLAG